MAVRSMIPNVTFELLLLAAFLADEVWGDIFAETNS